MKKKKWKEALYTSLTFLKEEEDFYHKQLEVAVQREDEVIFHPNISNRWAWLDHEATDSLNKLRKIQAIKQEILMQVDLSDLPREWAEYLLRAK